MYTNKMNAAQKLMTEVNNKIATTEYETVTFKGVKNLSRSDLETILLYAETFIENGGTGFDGLMEPMDNVRSVFVKSKIIS